MTDTMKTTGQDMDQKTPDKLTGVKRHGFWPIPPFGAIIFPLEGNALLIVIDESTVRNGHPVGIAGQIGQYRFGSGEGAFGLYNPRLLP